MAAKSKSKKSINIFSACTNKIKYGTKNIRKSIADLKLRRPHASFVRTRRRDYQRPLVLPGYFTFTSYVVKQLLLRKREFGLLILLYSVVAALLSGAASQSAFTQLLATLNDTSSNAVGGAVSAVQKSGILLFTGLQGNFIPNRSDAQQVYGGFLFLFLWLTTIWLLRNYMAKGKPRLRDAIYNAGAPIIPTALLLITFIIQLVPAALAIVGYRAALSTDFLSNGAIAMLFAGVGLLLIVLSLYFVTSTFIAMVIVTLPGMYPIQAMRTAGDLVVGRRIRILLRLLWMVLVVGISVISVLFVAILFASWFQTSQPDASWIPIVPTVFTLSTSASAVFASAYVYLLYRKVVDDDAAPA